MKQKEQRLREYFEEHTRVAVAFSGGVDSAYLLYAASQYAENVHAYYVKSVFQPQFELEDAKRLAKQLGVPMTILNVDVLSDEEIVKNQRNRCYFCKRKLMEVITKQAGEDRFFLLIDGTNASDDADDRPGMVALRELQVQSPLRECGLGKEDIRELSKAVGLFTWDKPAYACLATRIATGEEITEEKIRCTKEAEEFMKSLGFIDFRVRRRGDSAVLQVQREQMEHMLLHRERIVEQLGKYYKEVVLDLKGRTQ